MCCGASYNLKEAQGGPYGEGELEQGPEGKRGSLGKSSKWREQPVRRPQGAGLLEQQGQVGQSR